MSKAVEDRERVVVRFAGDSGDGMQLAGSRFTDATAVLGNDLATLPNFPAEIRAPAGTLAGVSAFQIHFASRDILTPGDTPNVLIAMNPAALKANLPELERGATIIANEDAFSKRNLEKAGYASNPLEDESLADYRVHRIPMTTLTTRAVEAIDGASTRDASRAKNLFALGVVSWLYGRPTEVTERWIEQKFSAQPAVAQANLAAFKAGWSFGETTELLDVQYRVARARDVPPGTYRNVNGIKALSLGLIAASVRSELPLLLASYPITPASELLHELSRQQQFGVQTIQAEDEIAAAGMALGAAFGGRIGVTATSGPGMDLKAETVGLAIALELPLVVIDVQRAGPSTGMPTKTEQADLLMALFGRHGESPLPVIAPSTPGGCFDAAFEAVRIAIRYRTPVILLSDTFLASSSEPWRLPVVEDLPKIDPAFAVAPTDGEFMPYVRDERLARPWAVPGTAGLQHRIGGLEKEDVTGNISYEASNHARMTELRAAKIAGIEVPPLEVEADAGASLLVLGWGSSEGAIRAGARRAPGDRPRGGDRAPPPPESPAGEHGRRLALIRPRAGPRDEHGPAGAAAAGPLPGRRRVVLQGHRAAIVRRRDRARDRVEGGQTERRRIRPRGRRPRGGDPAVSAVAKNGNGGAPEVLTKADFQSDQETRWCPGCGDYAVLSAVQQFMPELGIPPHKIVFITGIGCAGRFAYYMDTYGMHGIHGRAPALATGLASSRDDLSIWVVTGDGDSLSIGGNHLIHALRRNVPIKILLFNNQIYGLTKGQASPTSGIGKVTKSTPFGVSDHPFNPLALALGAEGTFVARTIDRDRHHLTHVLRAAAQHEGAALIEIYQNCPVFNDGAFAALTEKEVKDSNQIRLEAGQPIRFGVDGRRGVARGASGLLEIVDVDDVGEDQLIVHDPANPDPAVAYALARLAEDPTGPTPIGIFRQVQRRVYGRAHAGSEAATESKLAELLSAGDTWTVA